MAMPDWRAYVRSHLALPGLTPERESRIVRELAAQLEDFYRDAIGRGASEAEAEAHAAAQITDWTRMADDVLRADRVHAKPRVERIADSLQDAAPPSGGRRAGSWFMAADALREFLFRHVYTPLNEDANTQRAQHIVRALFAYFVEDPARLPAEPHADPENESGDDAARRAADYVASMTDRYAIELYEQIFVPRHWSV